MIAQCIYALVKVPIHSTGTIVVTVTVRVCVAKVDLLPICR